MSNACTRRTTILIAHDEVTRRQGLVQKYSSTVFSWGQRDTHKHSGYECNTIACIYLHEGHTLSPNIAAGLTDADVKWHAAYTRGTTWRREG